MPNNSQTMAVAGVGGVALFALVVMFAVRRRKRRRSVESLFGSTIKMPPLSPTFAQASVNVQPGQPHSPDALQHTYSANDLENFGLPPHTEGGLSCSTVPPWSSVDKTSDVSYVSSSDESGRLKWKLSFKLQYRVDSGQLEVTIFRAKCTPERYSAGLDTSVFACVYLLPEQECHQTALYPNTGSPSFDESFIFQIVPVDFSSKQLRLSLYDMDATRTRICLGHAIVKLGDLENVGAGGVAYLNKTLEQLATVLDEPGPEVHVSLYYNPQHLKLKVQLFAAKNLPESTAERTYALRTSVILGTKTAKQKETLQCDSLYGVFQCSYAFQVPPRHIDNCCLKFQVLERCKDQAERTIGTLIIGPCMYAHGSGVDHWKHMLQNSRKTVEMWHRLTLLDM